MAGAIIEVTEKLDVSSTSWTASKIKDLLRCAQQYWYSQHPEYVPVVPPPPILEQGSYAHEWAESYIQKKPFPPRDRNKVKVYKLAESDLNEISELMKSFKEFLDNLPKTLEPFVGKEFTGCSEGSFALDNKLKPTHPFNKNRLLSGKIDYYALSKNDGPKDAVIIDYKTTLQTKIDPVDHELQLNMYSFLLSKYFPLRNVAVGIYYVKQAQLEWLPDDKGLILHPYEEPKVVATLRSYMTKARDAASQPSLRNIGPGCSNCRYKAICLP